MAGAQLLATSQRIALPIDQVFASYGYARNLERITPPWLGFEVTTPGPIEMGVGTLIEYRLRLHRAPVRWRTRFEVWEPPRRFSSRSTSRPASSNLLTSSRFAHGCRNGAPIVKPVSTYFVSPPRCPSSSSPRCRRPQQIIPASGTKIASMPPSASLSSVSAANPSSIRSPTIAPHHLRSRSRKRRGGTPMGKCPPAGSFNP